MGLLERRFVVVTGKGGVGKTTVAAALGVALARRGRRVLVAMVNARERLSGLYEAPRVGPRIAAALPGIDAVNMTPEASLEEFGLLTLRFRALYRLVFENRVVRSFLSAVPGLDAWAMLGKATYHAVERDAAGRHRYDTVILDAPPTGHVQALLSVPRTIAAVAPPGPLRRDAVERAELLEDPARTEVLPVTVLEEMPVTETGEAVLRLRDELRLSVRRVVVNAVLPARFAAEEIDDLERRGVSGAAVPLLQAARFDLRRRTLQDEQRRRLASLVRLPTVELPLLRGSRLRRDGVGRLAEGLDPVL
jgi:anion-transporting  ArsA/GET3 family ATPase